ncbi:MAG TPA: class I SAM-dependent methyltransferase [Nannocystaceae bacterium]|nr:class I SAM-dependent methyltransferase [Nannocystaceae bacterium]
MTSAQRQIAYDLITYRLIRAAGRYDAIADALFDEDFCHAVALQNRYCDLLLRRLWCELDLGARLARPRTCAQLVERLGFVPSAEIAGGAVLRRLARRVGVVRVIGGAPLRFVAHGRAPDPTAELADLRHAMEDLGPQWTNALELMEFGADHFVVALRDDPELMDRVLSGREPQHVDMWHRATNADPLQDVHGVLGAHILGELFRGGTILEVGGGTGNGIRNVLAHLDACGRLGLVRDYLFTDISTRFLLGTRKEIRKRWPTVPTQWRYLDINEPLHAQTIPVGEIDTIYAVNAAHVAKDIVAFLRGCKGVLRRGGRVVFSERIRWIPDAMAPRELALDLSVYRRTAAQRSSARPMHCYLHPADWQRVLERAGFKNVEILPDLERLTTRMPEPYAAVVTGVAL